MVYKYIGLLKTINTSAHITHHRYYKSYKLNIINLFNDSIIKSKWIKKNYKIQKIIHTNNNKKKYQ